MCGDGANDCGALRAAHTGISLSEAESSVASPFTSQVADISCVPRVIKECRAALVTSFGVFKFMVLYSLTQFLSTIFLYSIDSNLTQNEFLFIDLCLGLNFAFSFGKNHAYSGPLVPTVPLTSIFSTIALSSMVFQVVLVAVFQYLSFTLVQQKEWFSWFVPFEYRPNDPTYYTSYENYAVFSLSQFQYITIAFIYSQGAPYREPIYTNKVFFSSIVIMVCVCAYLTLWPASIFISLLELKVPEKLDFPIVVLCLAGVYFVISLFFENFIVQYVMFKKLRHFVHNVEKSKKKYLSISRSLDVDTNWPPLGHDLSQFVDETNKKPVRCLPSGHDNPAFTSDEVPEKFTTQF